MILFCVVLFVVFAGVCVAVFESRPYVIRPDWERRGVVLRRRAR